MNLVIPKSTRWPITLRAGALVLRPLTRGDEADWLEVRATNQAWLGEWDATNPPQSWPATVTFASMLQAQRVTARRGQSLPWVLAWDDTWPQRSLRRPKLIGQVTVSGITWGSAWYGFIGYWIDRRFAGRGLVPLAVALACDYCFQTLHLHRLEIDVLPENHRSHRVVEKLGFKPDGQRRSLLHINGRWRDHEAYVMTAEDTPPSLASQVLAGRPVPGAR